MKIVGKNGSWEGRRGRGREESSPAHVSSFLAGNRPGARPAEAESAACERSAQFEGPVWPSDVGQLHLPPEPVKNNHPGDKIRNKIKEGQEKCGNEAIAVKPHLRSTNLRAPLGQGSQHTITAACGCVQYTLAQGARHNDHPHNYCHGSQDASEKFYVSTTYPCRRGRRFERLNLL